MRLINTGYMEQIKLKIHLFIYLHISETICSRIASDLERALGGHRYKLQCLHGNTLVSQSSLSIPYDICTLIFNVSAYLSNIVMFGCWSDVTRYCVEQVPQLSYGDSIISVDIILCGSLLW